MPSFPKCSLRISAARPRGKLPGMKYDLKTFRGDLFGGITSAVIALPVALAFGIASGLGAVPDQQVVENRNQARQIARKLLGE